jgi:hypothetical protein
MGGDRRAAPPRPAGQIRQDGPWKPHKSTFAPAVLSELDVEVHDVSELHFEALSASAVLEIDLLESFGDDALDY